MQFHLRLLPFIFAFLGALAPLPGKELHDGRVVRGYEFEGVIFTPQMIENGGLSTLSGQKGLWTPEVALVLKAEAALPHAIAEKTKIPKPVRGVNYPKYYTQKNSTNLNMSDGPAHPAAYDSDIENNFLYNVSSYYNMQKWQYIGVTVDGKRLLLISFIYGPGIYADSYLDGWKHHWVWVMDGYDNFWRVLYDPAAGTFSEWNCNGHA